MNRIHSDSISIRGAYWDDLFVKGDVKAVVEVIHTLELLANKTNLKLRLSKCHVYAYGEETANKCRELFPPKVTVHDDLNILWLKTPIGSDEFVSAQLNLKLREIKSTIDKVSKIPFKMEAFTLLRNC